MPQVRFLQRARDDLQRLREFIEEYSPKTAHRMEERLVDEFSSIASRPFVGRMVVSNENLTINENLREWVFKFGDSGYVILYYVQKDCVLILAIRHQREVGYFS